MTAFSFDLRSEAFITVLMKDGRLLQASLREVLEQAPRIQKIVGIVPIIPAALMRHLLLPLLMRVFPLRDDRDWQALWQAGALDMHRIDEYLDGMAGRFDLFHPTRPFYQAADKRVQPKSLLKLIPHRSSGNNATLFDHSTEQRGITLEAAEAALYVIALQTYGLGGLSGIQEKFTAAPACPGISFFVEGNNLFETLMLNLLPAEGDPSTYRLIARHPILPDLPAWEQDDPFRPRDSPTGMIDYLTWQNRRVLLLPEVLEGRVVVRRMTEAPGLRLREGFLDGVSMRDPYQFYRQGSQAPVVLRFSEARAMWRDSAALYQFETRASARNDEAEKQLTAPTNLSWLNLLARRGVLPKSAMYRLSALGMAANKSKVLFYGEENMPLPAALLDDPELVGELRRAMQKADALASGLRTAAWKMAELIIKQSVDQQDEKKPDRKTVEPLFNHLTPERVFWSELEIAFYQFVAALPQDAPQAMQDWEDTLNRKTWRALDHSLTLAGDSLPAQKAAVFAREIVAYALTKTLEKKEEKQDA